MLTEAIRVRRAHSRPSPVLIDPFRTVPTGNVCDAQGRWGALDHQIRSITSMAEFAGPALTVWAGPRDNLACWAALEYVVPGDVMVIATGDYTRASVIGDIFVGMARNAGVVAIVTDGMVRDQAGIEAMGIPVFARGVTPNSPWKNGPGEIGGTVVIAGEAIAAGDILVGDPDGVVLVSQPRLAAVAKELEEVRAKEAKMEAAVREGVAVPSWLAETKKRLGVAHVD